MFKFGWLTITAEDLVVWKQFPSAMFTLVPVEPSEDGEEYRLGSFDLDSRPYQHVRDVDSACVSVRSACTDSAQRPV
jgi:hypothetical protein